LPVCLKCGKEIDPGEEYCAECGASDDQSVGRLLALAELNAYRPAGNRRPRWVTLSLLALAVILFAAAVGLLLSIPTGQEFRERAQASVCRANLARTEEAVDDFYRADGKYPPTGRIDADHPLITDQYFDNPLRCPSTGHYYILEQSTGAPYVRCDSGLPGHEL
jgi:zinc-ribbon domain